MKRLLTLTLVLALTSFASAVTVKFEVDPVDQKEQYEGGDIITINIVSNNPILEDVSYFQVSNITSDNGGQATGPRDFNLYFYDVISKGTLVNAGDPYVLINNLDGSEMMPGPPLYDYYYYFEFEVPFLTEPGFVTIDDYGQTSIGHYGLPWLPAWEVNNISALQLNVVPEPATILLLGLGGLSLMRKRSA